MENKEVKEVSVYLRNLKTEDLEYLESLKNRYKITWRALITAIVNKLKSSDFKIDIFE
ncbi:MAG: hypothetical protein N2558_04705 [Patescibacteria group bacterium]|nr:hypothetical protein [Patescibacteria group bacterium]